MRISYFLMFTSVTSTTVTSCSEVGGSTPDTLVQWAVFSPEEFRYNVTVETPYYIPPKSLSSLIGITLTDVSRVMKKMC